MTAEKTKRSIQVGKGYFPCYQRIIIGYICSWINETVFEFHTWGGKRRGAGRRRMAPRPRVPHRERPALAARDDPGLAAGGEDQTHFSARGHALVAARLTGFVARLLAPAVEAREAQ